MLYNNRFKKTIVNLCNMVLNHIHIRYLLYKEDWVTGTTMVTLQLLKQVYSIILVGVCICFYVVKYY
jgi:hypothetical protein